MTTKKNIGKAVIIEGLTLGGDLFIAIKSITIISIWKKNHEVAKLRYK